MLITSSTRTESAADKGKSMSEQKAFLEKVHIKNYRSLRNVIFPLKPLTVFVGPNASGKSNVLAALYLFKEMMTREELPTVETIQNSLWAGKASHIDFRLYTKMGNFDTEYQLGFKAEINNPFIAENLLVNSVKIISILNGQGTIQDEDEKNKTTYKSNKLALKSAGDYGNKPVTNALTKFIRSWEFYDFHPDFIRNHLTTFSPMTKDVREPLQLDSYGFRLGEVLSHWHINTPENFRIVSESLAACTNTSIDHRSVNGENQLCLLGGYKNPISVENASDGTLRLLAYHTLLNQSELPPLIAIEEPERNLHPGALKEIACVLERLAERTQVIITTHSSQLLDSFSSKDLSDWLGVLLLRNRPGLGTEVLNIEEIRDKRESLAGWIADFGIGSAVFDSGLLQDLMEEPI